MVRSPALHWVGQGKHQGLPNIPVLATGIHELPERAECVLGDGPVYLSSPGREMDGKTFAFR